MKKNQVWKSKETKNYLMKIIGHNPDGTVKITFDFRYNPRTVHNYQSWYIDQYYEYAGYDSVWTEGKDLTPINDFSKIDPEKVLFGNYTGADKVNVWKEIK